MTPSVLIAIVVCSSVVVCVVIICVAGVIGANVRELFGFLHERARFQADLEKDRHKRWLEKERLALPPQDWPFEEKGRR